MAKAVGILIVLALVILVVVVVANLYTRMIVRGRRQHYATSVALYAVHPNEASVQVSPPLALDDAEFDYRIEEYRSTAMIKIAALNSGVRKGESRWQLEEHPVSV